MTNCLFINWDVQSTSFLLQLSLCIGCMHNMKQYLSTKMLSFVRLVSFQTVIKTALCVTAQHCRSLSDK
jgi:hypothetical protein